VPDFAPMTALQIGMTASPRLSGGLDRYFFSLLRALVPLGVMTRGLVAGNSADVAAQGIDGVEAFAGDDTSLLARWARLRGAVNRRIRGCDLVVSHFAPYAFPVLDRIRTHPTVVHFHGSWARESEAAGARGFTLAAKLALERLVYRGGTRFVVLTNASAQKLQRDFNVPTELIRVVPGGVDIARFAIAGTRDDARRALRLPLGRPTILTASRLIRAKGIATLIEALTLVRERVPDVLLVIAGMGPFAADLLASVHERGLESAVRFTGFLDDCDLQHAYRAADLLVVPTLAIESFGLVAIEAMACGTPAMVTPVDGLPETVGGLDQALIFDGIAPHDLARGLLAALEGTLVLPTPAACRAYAERFDWSRIATSVRDVYEEIA
jgi:glycosyltransferase involved in cell wall biosynthesis